MYKALDARQSRLVALKVFRPDDLLQDLVETDELRRRFLAEARLMHELQHRHVAAVIETGEYCGRPYLVQEYLCMNLAQLIGEAPEVEPPARRLSPLRALEIADQTLQGLEHLHRAGVVHRDIKPANLHITQDRQVKIIDFGLSRVRDQELKYPPGVIVGSPYYAAPEQIEEPDKADLRADLYALGVVLVRMVTGNLPEVRDLKDLDDELFGPEWRDFLKTALAVDPGRRFNDAGSMLEALSRLRRNWEKSRDRVCVLTAKEAGFRRSGPFLPRGEPLHTKESKNLSFLELDRLLQPRSHVRNQFQKTEDGMLDQTTMLVWGEVSKERMHFEQAHEYVRFLNQSRVWRLPTVDELVSLMQPRKSLEDFCGPALMQLEKRFWLWSADTKSRSRAWLADMEQGAVMDEDRLCSFHVLLVRSAEKEELSVMNS